MEYEKASFRRNPNREFLKWFLPYIVGFFIALFIWVGWASPQLSNDNTTDTNFVFSVMGFIILALEGPIALIEIYLLYRKKVVKMTPKSAYNIVNIIDYAPALERYKQGNYDFESIKTEEDIMEAYENGKMIIFTKSKILRKIVMWIGIGVITFGLIIGTIIGVTTGVLWGFIIVASIFCIIGIILLIQSQRLSKSFFILDPEGIIYKNPWGFVRSYSWRELGQKIYSVKTTQRGLFKIEYPASIEIHLILPNKAVLRVEPESYDLKEFFSLKKMMEEIRLKHGKNYALALKSRSFLLFLVAKTFEHYYKRGKD